MVSQISRRSFLKAAGSTGVTLTLGGLDLIGCTRIGPASQAPPSLDPIDRTPVRDFAAGLHGSLLRPTDMEYESARQVWNARFDRRPAFIVRCADAADVKRAVDFARTERLLVAVRGGGHSMAGHSMCDGGLVIDLSRMKRIEIDRQRQEVRLQPGLLFSEINRATQESGLAIVTGSCPHVGIGGFMLGGGEGPLNGKYGMSCDNLISADVVLADGRLVTASEDDHADLFWALRGGGGNFGVVTDFRIRAHPVDGVVTGRLTYDLAQARTVIRSFEEFAPTAPDELDAGLMFQTRQTGRVFALTVFYAGDAASAEPVLRQLRSFANPTSDTITSTSYFAYKTPTPGRGGIGAPLPSTTRTAFLHDLPDAVIDRIIDVGARTSPAGDLQLNHLHGAASRVPLEATAFPLRQAGFDCFAAAAWLEPSQRDAVISWVQSFYDALRPYASGAYVNMLTEDEGDRVRPAYGLQYARLAALKKKYDPDNFFRLNPNIPPRV